MSQHRHADQVGTSGALAGMFIMMSGVMMDTEITTMLFGGVGLTLIVLGLAIVLKGDPLLRLIVGIKK